MSKENIENIANSIILTIEKLLLFSPKTDKITEVYLNFLLFLLRKYGIYDKVDVYFNFVLQLNRYNKKKIKRIIKWVLNSVVLNSDDDYYKSRMYYCISRSFLYLHQYNKAQNFAVKAMKYFYNVIDLSNSIHLLYYFELSLLISKLAFYRGKYVMSYNFLQHLFSKVLNVNIEGVFERNFIYLLLESSLWLIVSYLYVNRNEWDSRNLKEVSNYFIEIVSTFKNYIDIDKIKDYISSILLKNIKRFIMNDKVKRKKKRNYNILLSIVSELYEKVESIPNVGKILFSLYKDYIVNFMMYYPDNYRLANRFVMKSIYLNYYYIRSYNLIALSKFLLFKIMSLEKIYTNLKEYMSTVDVQDYIINNNDISEEVRKDILNKQVVYL
ncbi:MAG: hypothetical protein RMJ36_04830 [Candidatus Calescibacterium sp.]|nr:hypothetical protein [Candidatus Calescibacterium sp.]MDW8132959.1 hypothetical protein [Candidatus Calescibacterium sp.]